MDKAKRLGGAIATSTVGFIWGHTVLPWLVLVVSPIMTGWLAYLGNAEAYKIALAVQFAFAAMAIGLYHADLEISRRRIKGKLQFNSIRFGSNISGPGVFLGVVFSNASEFPIEFEIKELRTTIDDKGPKKKEFDVKNIVVPPHGLGWFDAHVIMIANIPKGGALEGCVEFSVAYGRPGNSKYDLTEKKQITVPFDGNGNLIAGSWHEAKRE